MLAIDPFACLQVKPTWVNETLSDSDGEMVNGDEQTIKAEPVEERKQKESEDPTAADTESPAAADTDPIMEAGAEHTQSVDGENGLAQSESAQAEVEGAGEENPLGDTNDQDEEQQQQPPPPGGEEEDLLQAAEGSEAAQDSGHTPLESTMAPEEEAAGKGLAAETFMDVQASAAGGFGGELSSVCPTGGEVESGAYSEQVKGLGEQPMTEEDLLTGPAHNLDDSQYKSDIVDPNLDDIFK